jgi:hypothetical protein
MSSLRSISAAQEDLGGVSRTTVWDLAREGYLEKVHIGRRAFITADSISSYIESLRAHA